MALGQEVECNNVHTKKASVIMKTMMLLPQVNKINYAIQNNWRAYQLSVRMSQVDVQFVGKMDTGKELKTLGG